MKRHFFFLAKAYVLLLLSLAIGPTAQAQDGPGEAYQQAYGYVLDEDWQAALSALRAVNRNYPESPWEDDAAFWICHVQEQQGATDENTFACYRDFVETHGDSKWADDARTNLVRLAQQLAQNGKPEYREVVRNFQQHDDEEVRLAALDALWQMGDESALGSVMTFYGRTDSPTFKKKIVYVLSQFDVPEARAHLEAIARDDDEVEVRKDAIFWLGQEGDAEVAATLEDIARNDSSVEIQKQVVFALAQLADEIGISQLIRIARTHPSEEVRHDAIFWIGQEGGPEAIDALQAIGQESGEVETVKKVVFSLAQIGGEGLDVLADYAEHHPEREVRKDAIFWLGQEGDASVLPMLERIMAEADDVEIQKQIVFTYSQLDDDLGVPRLIELARSHPNSQVRKDAVFWLGQSDDARARDALLDIVQGQ